MHKLRYKYKQGLKILRKVLIIFFKVRVFNIKKKTKKRFFLRVKF